jgi:hypothetical protein
MVLDLAVRYTIRPLHESEKNQRKISLPYTKHKTSLNYIRPPGTSRPQKNYMSEIFRTVMTHIRG